MPFAELGLSAPIITAITREGYQTPSPIQSKAIPLVLAGHDLMAAAQTGTGKTAGFALPILQLLDKGQRAKPNHIRALVLTPTRELAAQVSQSFTDYGSEVKLYSTVVFGGVKINPQMMRLRRGADILVATPGRLMDLYQQRAIKFDQLEMLVLDEADRMLDMGFIHDIKKILALLPEKRQSLLFSATFSDDIRRLARGFLNEPKEISVTPRNAAASTVTQWLCPVDKKQKANLLVELIRKNNWQQALVFTRTKHGANKLVRHLEAAKISATAIHGNKSQGARTKALSQFKSGEVKFLIATDIAARGLDIEQLPQVVNFDLPNVAEDYVHRIGRTGRAGADGQAVSLVAADEYPQLVDIERLIGKLLPRTLVDGFEPVHDLPISRLKTKPQSPKKPKKPKTEHRDGQHAAGSAKKTSAKPGSRPVNQNRSAKPAAKKSAPARTARPRTNVKK
ncbi:DEAD/DEAH box helicase [Pelagibaculum spongiae]|uniref:DEAD-box ATP-dependent RNA helicase RhpA n=1 Tax=Pelagibaculum spongiae TaxID=2080658 RepID=A0A2V1H5L0_9GAMM|nr:DEAD/DEAH box helicase [Pelagibaculum spongiae]PVZ72055.1 ATP-dependent RNA helicase [Pelagibaculum spongiae]